MISERIRRGGTTARRATLVLCSLLAMSAYLASFVAKADIAAPVSHLSAQMARLAQATNRLGPGDSEVSESDNEGTSVAAQPASQTKAGAGRLNGLVVFGDSLSDNGNAGRFSNGPIWVEIVAGRIGAELKPSRLGGSNYAVGGARVQGGASDLRSQIASYLAKRRGRAEADALHVVWGGADDVLAAGCQPGNDVAPRNAAAALASSINDLAAAGARNILVANVPSLGYAPGVRAKGSACAAAARRLTQTFNAALEPRLQAVEKKRKLKIVRLDVFSLVDQAIRNPAAAGLTNVTTPCRGRSCDGAFFWDSLHPTAFAHARLAAEALRALQVDVKRAMQGSEQTERL